MKKLIKDIIGSLLVFAQPRKAAELSRKGMTLVDELTIEERFMRHAILKKAEHSRDFDGLAKIHRDFWVKKGRNFFAENEDRFESLFLPNADIVVDGLQQQLAKQPGRFVTLVEIGTGNGNVLNYLAGKFPQIDKLIGIDLSPDQIDMVKVKFKENSRLEFVAADGMEWAKSHGQEHMIFFTFGGVLEYFTQKQVETFFGTLNSLGKTIVIVIEPVAAEHDYTIDKNSRPYGHESSFSHNYPLLFQNAGFEIWHRSEMIHVKNRHFFSFVGAKN